MHKPTLPDLIDILLGITCLLGGAVLFGGLTAALVVVLSHG